MSAFVVDDLTINRVLAHLSGGDRDGVWALVEEFAPEGDKSRAGLGLALRALNVRAVLACYPDCSLERGDLPGPSPLLPYRYAPVPAVSPVQALKSLECFLYQCSEGDVPETPLYLALEQRSHRWAHAIVSNLPDYDRAQWG